MQHIEEKVVLHNHVFTATTKMPFLEWSRKIVSCFVATETSVWTEVLCVYCCWDVSVGVSLEGGGEILLIVWVVYAVLGGVSLSVSNYTVGREREAAGGRDLVQILGVNSTVFKAVQVFRFCVIGGDGGKDATRGAGVLVVGIHHVRESILINVV